MPADVHAFVKYLAGHPILVYIPVSGAVLLLTDWLFALDMEIQYAWNGAWNSGRVLYFLSRYSAFLNAPVMLYLNVAYSTSPPLCGHLYTISSALSIFVIFVAELIMAIRVWALWGRRRDIGILLLIMSIVDSAATIATNILFGQPRYTVIDGFPSIVPGCFSIMGSTASWDFVPFVVHQTFIFALTAIKGVQHYKTGVYHTSLINTFYRDGLTYYALLVVLTLVNLAVTPRYARAHPNFLKFLQAAVHSILSARMLLHLRQGSDTLRDSKPLESLEFAVVEGPGGSLSVQMTRHLDEPDIQGDGWFGQEESPPHRS